MHRGRQNYGHLSHLSFSIASRFVASDHSVVYVCDLLTWTVALGYRVFYIRVVIDNPR